MMDFWVLDLELMEIIPLGTFWTFDDADAKVKTVVPDNHATWILTHDCIRRLRETLKKI